MIPELISLLLFPFVPKLLRERCSMVQCRTREIQEEGFRYDGHLNYQQPIIPIEQLWNVQRSNLVHCGG